MILFFHFICLLARYIISNFSKSLNRGKFSWDERSADCCADRQFSDYLREKTSYVKYPVYKNDTLTFFPPVYVQRYETVALILQDASEKYKIRKVADFGCAELGFFMYLKHIEGVTEILEVDIDVGILQQYSYKAAPLTSDYLMGKWTKPLDVYIFQGSIADFDDHLLGCDALIGIELIEHLSEEAFEKMPFNVFYKIKPKIIIFTTPNAEFNSLFPNLGNFRHKDHKFEWTRKEFYEWTQLILKLYPEYSVRFYGIGTGPEGTENLGCCTQMAVFIRSDDAEFFLSARDASEGINNYNLIKHYKYPFNVDSRTAEEKVVHEIQYQVAYLSTLDCYYNYENNESEIPLSVLKDFVSDLCFDDRELLSILNSSGMILRQKNNCWFLVCPEVESSPSDITSRCDDWLNEEISENFYDKEDVLLNDREFWEDEQSCLEYIPDFQTPENIKQLESNTYDRKMFLEKINLEGIAMTKEKVKSDPCGNHLVKIMDSSNLSTPTELKNGEHKKLKPNESRIPCTKSLGYEITNKKESGLDFLSKPFKKISKSYSLDSCLENINCKLYEGEYCYLNLIPGSLSTYVGGPLSSGKEKYMKHCSGSSLLSSSLSRAVDSGYPFSLSLPDDNLTPEQIDEIFTENETMSRSTSSSSEVNVIDIPNQRLHHDIFLDVPVENGDLANNNRDREGNNVEGLIGQRLVNGVAAERDPNDNLFFPEGEEFPPWLLNLGELAILPLYFPLHDGESDEGVGDDSSGDLSYIPDLEDIDADL